jgi:hypothetical protein
MANGEHEEVEELQGELDTDPQTLGEHEQDDGQGDDLATHGRALDGLLQQAQQAGLGDAPQARSLKHIRRALRRSKQYIREAEERGYQRALEEFSSGDGQQAVDAIRTQVRQEIQEETARERSFARLGIGPDSPVRSLFDNVSGDHKAFERHADLLRAAGITWNADPLVQQVARERVSAWDQAATQAASNGNVQIDPASPVPQHIQDRLIAEAVGQLQKAQAGGQQVGSEDLASEIRRAAQQDPSKLDEAARYTLADKLNNELEGLSANLRGLPTGEGW